MPNVIMALDDGGYEVFGKYRILPAIALDI
jgi:hypothetical protein